MQNLSTWRVYLFTLLAGLIMAAANLIGGIPYYTPFKMVIGAATVILLLAAVIILWASIRKHAHILKQ